MPEAGDTLGEFVLRREIGRGAMGVVWEAHQPSLDRTVAVKILKNVGDDPSWVERFRAEAGQVAKLSHRGILPIYAFGETGNDSWYAMELVKGEDLSTRLAREKQIPPRVAATWIRDAARALHHAHEHGVVHRDVKPANIMVQPDGRVVVMDFGLSKAPGSAGLTTTGMLIGTPYYMSPEMVAGQTEAGAPADVYALGVTLYELIDGQPPFLADNAVALIRMIADAPPPPLRPRGSTVSSEIVDLERITHRAMEKSPEKRYRSAAEMADDLDVIRADDILKPRGVGAPHRRWWSLWAITATVLGLGGLVAYFALTAADRDDRIKARDDEMRVLEERIADLIAKDDLEGAQAALDRHETARDRGSAGAKMQKALQKMGGQLFIARLASGMPGSAKARRDVLTWPAKKATLTLKVKAPGVSLHGTNLAASLSSSAIKASPDARIESAGVWRIVARAPGRMTTVATVVLPPDGQVALNLTLPAAPRDSDAVYYPGVWIPSGKSKGAPIRSVLDPYTLTSDAVRPPAYADFLGGAKESEREKLRIPSSPLNGPGRPVRVYGKQADAFAKARGARLPREFEFANAILPSLLALMHRKPGKEMALREDMRAQLDAEGRRDFTTDQPRFWVETLQGGFKAQGVPGYDGKRRRGGRTPRLPKSAANLGLILLARSP